MDGRWTKPTKFVECPTKNKPKFTNFKTGLPDKTTKAGKVYEYINKFLKKAFRFKTDFKNI